MKIRIQYYFHTDGDYCLKNAEQFSCIGTNITITDTDEFFDYVGKIDFSGEDSICKMKAKDFLKELLCDGLSFSSNHHYVMKYFFDAIDSLIHFININDKGDCSKYIYGNYDGTKIIVSFLGENNCEK